MKNLITNKKLQTIILWTFLLIAAITCLFSLAYATNFRLYDNTNVNYKYAAQYLNEFQGYSEDDPYWGYINPTSGLHVGGPNACNDIVDAFVRFCDNLNKTNTFIFVSQVIIVVLFAVVCIFGNKYRKKYYLSNLIAGVVAGVTAIAFNIVSIVLNNKVMSDYKKGHIYMAATKSFSNQSDPLNLNYQKIMLVFLIIGIVFYTVFTIFTVLKFIFSKDNNTEELTVSLDTDTENLSVEEAN